MFCSSRIALPLTARPLAAACSQEETRRRRIPLSLSSDPSVPARFAYVLPEPASSCDGAGPELRIALVAHVVSFRRRNGHTRTSRCPGRF